MAHEADLPTPEAEPEPTRLDRVLRLLESVMFCCLSALILFWVADRMRGVDFEPILVTPCVGADCVPYQGPYAGSPWSVFGDALDPLGVVSFSPQNLCVQLAETLQERGPEGEGVDLVLDLITDWDIVTVDRPETGPWTIGPGARNDGFFDVLRDALTMGPARGCHPINYKPVFWPLWLGWMLLASLRLFRNRQQEWARR